MRDDRSRGNSRGLLGSVGTRGSTLVETAIVLPIILLVVFASVEIGLAFKDFLTVGAMSRDGARIAALSARDAESDCEVLKAISAVGVRSDIDQITNVQIYKAAEGSGTQGATNTWTYNPGMDPAQCNIPAQVNDGWSPAGIAYPPSSRNTTISATPPPLDIIGVRVTLTRSWITGFPPFRGTYTVDDTAITRVEPEAFG